MTTGFQILSILPDSPALEAGLQPGDRIMAVDGVDAHRQLGPPPAISGEEGTQVTVTVAATGRPSRDFTLTRRAVDIPIVTYELVDGAGYIDCTSFGASTAATVQEALEELDDAGRLDHGPALQPRRDQQAAAASAGLFTGSGVMVYFRDGAGNYQYIYTTTPAPISPTSR